MRLSESLAQPVNICNCFLMNGLASNSARPRSNDRESGSWKSSFQRRLSYVRNRPAHRLQVVKPLDVIFSSHSGFQSGRCDGPAVNRRILVAYASQFGSTEEIAQAIF